MIKKNILHIVAGISMMLAVTACEKDQDMVTLSASESITMSASATELLLAKDNADQEAVVFSWTPLEVTWSNPDLARTGIITYTLQLDTVGGEFANPAEVEIEVENESELSYSVAELNSLLVSKFKIAPDVSHTIYARVLAAISSNIDPVYSNVVELSVTPYTDAVELPALWVPGGHQGWAPDTAPRVFSLEDDGIYSGYVYFPANNEFKFTSAPNWDNINYGENGPGKLSTDGGAGNLTVTEAGYYFLTANINELTWSSAIHSWGVLGDATAGGWDADQDLTYHDASKTLRATLPLTAGEIKFRLNDSWDVNLGDDGADGVLEANGANIVVPEAGNYEIILDLTNPASYTYTLNKL